MTHILANLTNLLINKIGPIKEIKSCQGYLLNIRVKTLERETIEKICSKTSQT